MLSHNRRNNTYLTRQLHLTAKTSNKKKNQCDKTPAPHNHLLYNGWQIEIGFPSGSWGGAGYSAAVCSVTRIYGETRPLGYGLLVAATSWRSLPVSKTPDHFTHFPLMNFTRSFTHFWFHKLPFRRKLYQQRPWKGELISVKVGLHSKSRASQQVGVATSCEFLPLRFLFRLQLSSLRTSLVAEVGKAGTTSTY